jgi:hypothetical protein
MEVMAKLNTTGFEAGASVEVQTFVSTRYMPWASENLSLNTSKNYRQVWKQRLSGRIVRCGCGT